MPFMTPTPHSPTVDFAAIAAAQARLAASGRDGDLEQIRTIVDTMVPFNNLVGVRMAELGPESAVAELADRAELLNHLGTVHAGALFLAGEVSCAGAFSGAAAARIMDVRMFALRSSQVAYLKPARGRIRATGTIDVQALAKGLAGPAGERFEMTGRALLTDDAGVLVCRLDFDYLCQFAA
jgi:acyl-coenzyme A thioesterase PaaI-like protein